MSNIHTDSRIVIERTKIDLGEDGFCFLTKSEQWIKKGEVTSRCGETSEFSREYSVGVTVEKTRESNFELGATAFALLSAKVQQNYGTTITINEITKVTEKHPLPSEKCTTCKYPWYQLYSTWDIEPFSYKKVEFRMQPYSIKVAEQVTNFL